MSDRPTQKDDYAYPGTRYSKKGINVGHGMGMTLRDHFAGQQLIAMGTWVPPGDYVDDQGKALPQHMMTYQRMVQDARAKYAYAQADAMLAAREQSGDGQ